MLEGYLPSEIYEPIKRYLNNVDVNEIRLRLNAPIIVSVKNKKYYLGKSGFCERKNAIFCSYSLLQNIVYKLCENSVYTVNDSLKYGYVTLPEGARVGIAGEVVFENGSVRTIKNFQSINIRIPHNIIGCSEQIIDYILAGTFKNTIIIAPPGAGKTTLIRDIISSLSRRNISYNILLVDERKEIANLNTDEQTYPLGDFVDIISNCDKSYAFNYGIRTMRPDIIVTDEIDLEKDLVAIQDAINCGVKVLTTIHAESIEQLKQKRNFEKIISNSMFERYVILSNKNGPGTVSKIYDEKFRCIFCG